MQLDIFCELQRARPWTREFEATLIDESLDQAKLADELGYGCWWQVEHHGASEFSLSSMPELFNVSIAHLTKNIHIGHSGVLAPFGINHPIRVAERAAYLDIVSRGRLEMGLARSSGKEWDHFDIDGDESRAQMMDLFAMLPKMWADGTFSWNNSRITIPEINVVPKPHQRPRPRLWQTATSADAFRFAGRMGVGAIGVTLLTPLSTVTELRNSHQAGLAEADLTVDGPVNDQLGMFTFTHCSKSRQETLRAGVCESVLWYMNSMGPVFNVPRSNVISMLRGNLLSGDANLSVKDQKMSDEDMDPNDPVPVIRLMNRQALGMPLDPEEVLETLLREDSIIIGDPQTCLKKIQNYTDLKVDRLLCFHQFGYLDHQDVMSSIRLMGEKVIPNLTKT